MSAFERVTKIFLTQTEAQRTMSLIDDVPRGALQSRTQPGAGVPSGEKGW